MYKITINRIRDIIVQLVPMPTMIKEYDKHVSCFYIFHKNYIIFDFTEQHVSITYFQDGEFFKDAEIIPIYDIEYMNIVISDFASRIGVS